MNNEELRMERNRKAIRSKQMKEMLIVGYYLWFAAEFVVRLMSLLRKVDIPDNVISLAYHTVSLVVEQEKRQKFSFWAEHRHPFYWRCYL